MWLIGHMTDPRNGRRRRRARVQQVDRLRLLHPSRGDIPENGLEPVNYSYLPLFSIAQTLSSNHLPHSESRDLEQLSALGHFLKGSSATLGLTKVKDSCEKIQNFGAKKDETGTNDVDDVDTCLKNLKEEIKVAKKEFEVVEGQLKQFYHDDGTGA